MSRARGNPRSKAEIELRRQKALDLMKENPQASLTEVAGAVGSSRSTLWRDLKALSVKLATTNLAEHEKRVAAQEAVLELMEQALLEEKIEPDVASAWRQIRADIAGLRGLNAPSKSLVAHTSPSHDILYMKFRKAIFDLTEAQVDDVLAYATKLPRQSVVTVRDASWFPQPEPKQLKGGGEDETA